MALRFVEPITWDPGEVVSSAVWNQQVADNFAYIREQYLDIRAAYKDLPRFTLSSSWAELGMVELDSRHEATILGIVATVPGTADFAYRLDGGARVPLASVAADETSIAW